MTKTNELGNTGTPLPIRKKLQRMIELKVGIKAMEAEYEKLKAEVLATKFAPQVYGDPLLGKLMQKENKQWVVSTGIVYEALGLEKFLAIAKVSKTALEENTTKQEYVAIEAKGAITSVSNGISYTFYEAKKPKDAK